MPSDQSSPDLRRVWPWLRWDLALLCLLAIGGEALVRLWAPAFQTQLFDQEYTGGYPMDLNADYYRGPLLPVAKAPGEKRLVALGDSTTFGTGVASGQTYIAALGALVQSRTGGAVSALNGGIEGASVRDLRHAYVEQWRRYAPDAVIVGLSPNMVSMALVQPAGEVLTVKERYREDPAQVSLFSLGKRRLSRWVHQLALPSFLSRRSQQLFYWVGAMNHNLDPHRPYGALLAYGYRQGDLPEAVAAKAWTSFTADLTELAAAVQADHRQLIFTLIEPRFMLTSQLSDNQKNVPTERFSLDAAARIEQLSAALGVPFVAATAVLRGARSRAQGRNAELYLLLDYAHLDAEGHSALAAALAPLIR